MSGRSIFAVTLHTPSVPFRIGHVPSINCPESSTREAEGAQTEKVTSPPVSTRGDTTGLFHGFPCATTSALHTTIATKAKAIPFPILRFIYLNPFCVIITVRNSYLISPIEIKSSVTPVCPGNAWEIRPVHRQQHIPVRIAFRQGHKARPYTSRRFRPMGLQIQIQFTQ